MSRRMEYIDSWLFNRGQEITLRKGKKYWHVSIQLFHRYPKYPFVYLKDMDRERLLMRALALIKKDVAKDNEDVKLLDEVSEIDTNLTPFPLEVYSESQEMKEFLQSPEVKELLGDMRQGIERRTHVQELEKQWRKGED